MNADILTEIPEKIFSQCGLVSALLAFAVIWLAIQLAKTRVGWETDRAGMMQVIRSQNTSYENLVISHSKLESVFLRIGQP